MILRSLDASLPTMPSLDLMVPQNSATPIIISGRLFLYLNISPTKLKFLHRPEPDHQHRKSL
jgi:hypothetical protein